MTSPDLRNTVAYSMPGHMPERLFKGAQPSFSVVLNGQFGEKTMHFASSERKLSDEKCGFDQLDFVLLLGKNVVKSPIRGEGRLLLFYYSSNLHWYFLVLWLFRHSQARGKRINWTAG